MAELGSSNKQENEMDKRIKSSKKQMIVVTLIATLTFAVGFTVGRCYDSNNPVGKVPVLTREAGFEAFLFSFLCCIASILTYTVIRSEATSTWKLHDLSLFTLVLALAALTFVLRMYAVLTHSTYAHLWVVMAVVGLVCFLLLAFVIYVKANRIALGIGLAAIIGHLLYPSHTRPHDSQHNN